MSPSKAAAVAAAAKQSSKQQQQQQVLQLCAIGWSHLQHLSLGQLRVTAAAAAG
jgi:hypothetical protein